MAVDQLLQFRSLRNSARHTERAVEFVVWADHRTVNSIAWGWYRKNMTRQHIVQNFLLRIKSPFSKLVVYVCIVEEKKTQTRENSLFREQWNG